MLKKLPVSFTRWRGDNMIDSAAGQGATVDGYSLSISGVRLTDLGEYTCQAYNNMVSSLRTRSRGFFLVKPEKRLKKVFAAKYLVFFSNTKVLLK